MKVALYNQAGEETGTVELPDRIFNVSANPSLIHQAVVAQLGGSRQVLAHAKGRSEVRGGGRKPWRQKGTGRARHGSIRSPIWKGGGATFGPAKERNFSKKINKSAKQKAMFMILSAKVKDKKFLVLDDLKFEKGKTKEASRFFDAISLKFDGYRKEKKKRDTILLVTEDSKEVRQATRNLPFAGTIGAKSLNAVDLLSYKYLLILKNTIAVIEKTYSKA